MRESVVAVDVPGADPGLRIAAATDAGHHRRSNEDSLLAEFPVFIVADGMGGHDAGDVASASVVRAFGSLVGRDDVSPDDVAAAMRRAHQTVAALSDRTRRGAGSTLTGIVQVRHDGVPFWLVVNVGDSRVYRVRAGRFERMTIDHSYVQEQLDAGLITQEEADNFEHRNVITRAVGAPDSPVDYWVHPVEPGERLLICSDGLHGEVTEGELYDVLAGDSDAGGAVTQLIDLALAHGGHDNVTAVIVDVQPVVEDGAPVADDTAPVAVDTAPVAEDAPSVADDVPPAGTEPEPLSEDAAMIEDSRDA
ncbi:protein phosphatase 2C domain-containing protein [Gryllotalpicola reticulitermitis]|uniref:Protein phosphatase 2C domain-containing protein n=1 Tax=Gryllotalpicola reticulitermitis TaxID=1184153 RepID=A0ABV8Q525_9MICO